MSKTAEEWTEFIWKCIGCPHCTDSCEDNCECCKAIKEDILSGVQGIIAQSYNKGFDDCLKRWIKSEIAAKKQIKNGSV